MHIDATLDTSGEYNIRWTIYLSKYPIWWYTEHVHEYSASQTQFILSLCILSCAISSGTPDMSGEYKCLRHLLQALWLSCLVHHIWCTLKMLISLLNTTRQTLVWYTVSGAHCNIASSFVLITFEIVLFQTPCGFSWVWIALVFMSVYYHT